MGFEGGQTATVDTEPVRSSSVPESMAPKTTESAPHKTTAIKLKSLFEFFNQQIYTLYVINLRSCLTVQCYSIILIIFYTNGIDLIFEYEYMKQLYKCMSSLTSK